MNHDWKDISNFNSLNCDYHKCKNCGLIRFTYIGEMEYYTVSPYKYFGGRKQKCDEILIKNILQ